VYSYADVPAPGLGWWYRVVTVGGGGSVASLPVFRASESPAGTGRFAFRHATPETDLQLELGVGDPAQPAWFDSLSLYRSIDRAPDAPLIVGSSLPEIAFSVELPAAAGGFLPPGPSSIWWFRATEGGDPLHGGLLTAFSIEHLGMVYPTSSFTPLPTVEGQATTLWTPQAPTTGVSEGRPSLPLAVFPNPMRASTTIGFFLEREEAVRISVLDVRGRRVREVFRGSLGPGNHRIRVDGRTDHDQRLPAGRFFVRLSFEGGVRVVPLLILDR
jgi:hypothetical protein